MTNRLDKLEGMGLVRREPDPADRRGIIAVLTEQGRSVLDRYIDVQARREQQLLRRLTEADKRTLNDLLRKLLTSLVDG
jgi:DNA-binding MarR family transcriptional regulator